MKKPLIFSDDGTNIDISTDSTETDTSSKSVIKIRRDQVDAGKNVWFTSYQGNSTLFISDTKFDLDGQIIGAGAGLGFFSEIDNSLH